MSHFSSEYNQHIVPVSFTHENVEYISYGGLMMDKRCECFKDGNHLQVKSIIHNQTRWPRLVRFLSSYKPFNLIYSGVLYRVSYDEWLEVTKNMSLCSCCEFD